MKGQAAGTAPGQSRSKNRRNTGLDRSMSLAAVERIEWAARISVLRSLGFCALAIVTLMVGLSYNPALACKMGGMFALVVAGVLMVKAYRAPHVNHRRTEVWLILDRETGLDDGMAARVIRRSLGDLYRRFALYHGYAATALGLFALVL